MPMRDRVACESCPVAMKCLEFLIGDETHRPERNIERTGRVTFRQDKYIVVAHDLSVEMQHGIKSQNIASNVAVLGFVMHLQGGGSCAPRQRACRAKVCLGVRQQGSL